MTMTDAEFLHLAFLAFTEERWKPVPGFPAYEVSSWGKVRSYWERWTSLRKGCWRIGETPKIIPPVIKKPSGHHNYVLTNGDKQAKTSQSARLVLMAFDRLPEPGEQARHIHDPDPSNNHLWNLAWGSRLANKADQFRHRGEYAMTKRSPDQIREIRALRKAGMLMKDIALKLDVPASTVSCVLSGRIRSSVPDH